jgi:outer membrane scaffolding protein for murein synthesis (MipA/OmpV family)
VYTKYAWRGQLVEDKAVIQPELTVEHQGFSLGVLQNYSTDQDWINEYNITLGYAYTWKSLALMAGIIEYDYPNLNVESTQEGFVRLAYSTAWLVPFVESYWDFNEVDGWYGAVGAERSFELTKELALDAQVSVGAADSNYHTYYFELGGTRMADAQATVGVPWSITESLTLTPSVQYSVMLDDDVRDTVTDKDIWVGSLALTYGF